MTEVVVRVRGENETGEAFSEARRSIGSFEEDVRESMTGGARATDRFSDSLGDLGRDAQRADFSLRTLGLTNRVLMTGLLGITAGGFLGAARRGVADLAEDTHVAGLSFEDFARRTGLAGDQLAGFSSTAVSLATRGLPLISRSEVADALGQIALRGFGATESLVVLSSAVELTSARGGDLSENATAVASAMQAWGLSAKEAAAVQVSLEQASAMTGKTIPVLTSELLVNRDAFRLMGLDVEQATKFIGSMGATSSEDVGKVAAAFASLTDQESAFAINLRAAGIPVWDDFNERPRSTLDLITDIKANGLRVSDLVPPDLEVSAKVAADSVVDNYGRISTEAAVARDEIGLLVDRVKVGAGTLQGFALYVGNIWAGWINDWLDFQLMQVDLVRQLAELPASGSLQPTQTPQTEVFFLDSTDSVSRQAAFRGADRGVSIPSSYIGSPITIHNLVVQDGREFDRTLSSLSVRRRA